MGTNIIILGGYGGAGRPIVENLLKYTQANVLIAGRHLDKAIAFTEKLSHDYPPERIDFIKVDAGEISDLITAFASSDLAIVATTTPEFMVTIAQAAIETRTHLLDIFIRGDVVDMLADYNELAFENDLFFITQAGIHPGLAAPLIKYASPQFDHYQEARVCLAMDAIFDSPESTYELIHDIVKSDYRVLSDGVWKDANYKDAVTCHFPRYFGKKNCYPLNLREINSLDLELGLINCGVYAAGFNPFMDYFLFPLAYFIGKFNLNLSQKIVGKLMYWSKRGSSIKAPRTEVVLAAKGMKGAKPKEVKVCLSTEDGYDLTALAVIACLKQLFDRKISSPGVHLMGNIADPELLMADLKAMSVEINEELEPQFA